VKHLTNIRENRQSDYGPFRRHFKATGQAWGGILLQLGWTPPPMKTATIPADKVGLFFSADKIMREANAHKADNVDDGMNYLRMSGEAAEDVSANALELRGWAVQDSPVSTPRGQAPELNGVRDSQTAHAHALPPDPQRVDVLRCEECHSKIRGEK
jgi:hypothetical protein